ncbi:hypothetical protein C0J52_12099 [Blattella germanica]|nr:hypothetical protein C0J52_12099 [Blattella germanica]
MLHHTLTLCATGTVACHSRKRSLTTEDMNTRALLICSTAAVLFLAALAHARPHSLKFNCLEQPKLNTTRSENPYPSLSPAILLSMVVLTALIFLDRQKRVSDQRLAELETYIALRNLAGKIVTVPVGFGQVDPAKIGRRRRRSAELLLQELLNSPTAHEDAIAEAADAILSDNNVESEEELREAHRPTQQQWLPEYEKDLTHQDVAT